MLAIRFDLQAMMHRISPAADSQYEINAPLFQWRVDQGHPRASRANAQQYQTLRLRIKRGVH